MEEKDTVLQFSYKHTWSSEFIQRSTKWQKIEISALDNNDKSMIISAHKLCWDGWSKSL